MKRLCILLLVLMNVCCALAEGTLTLPAGLEVIEEEAFYGITAFDQVVLPSGVREIHSRAFAGTGITEVTLPDSLTFIADDAFDGPGQVHVTVNPDTYAYRWAAGLGYLLDAPVQANSKGLRNKITVSWEAVEDAAGYNVYYGTSSNISDATEIKGVTETTWTIENLESGTVYYTWVKAVNGIRVSVPSNMESVITIPVPPVITNVSVFGNTITLEWNAATGAEVYRLYYNTENNFDSATATEGIEKTYYPIEGLEYNTIYYIWIASVNTSGGLASGTARIVSTEADPFIPVQNPSEGHQNSIKVSWNAVEEADSYNIYYGTTDSIGTATAIIGLGIEETEYTVSELNSGTVYYTWIKAVSGAEISGASNMESVITLPDLPSLNPTVSGNTISLSWNAVTGADYYRIYYGTTDVFDDATPVNNILATEYILSDLEYDTDYYFWISARNSSGGLRSANPKTAKTDVDPFIPIQTSPKGLQNKITVNWLEVEGATSYNIYYGTENDISQATAITVEGTNNSCDINDLASGTRYYTWIKAVDENRVSAPSNMMSVMTYADIPMLSEPSVSINTVTLSWNAVTGAMIYRLYYSTSSTFSSSAVRIETNDTSCTVTDLECSTPYYFWVSAVNTSGGLRSDPVSATTGSDAFAPIQITPVGLQNKITVKWNPVDDANSYIVCYGTSERLSEATELTVSEGTSCTIDGLVSGTWYYTWVKAVDENRVSAPSNRMRVITYSDAPKLKTLTAAGNTISMTWNVVPGATKYLIRYNHENNFDSATTITIDDTSTTAYTIENLEYGTLYHIWISSTNSSGGLRNKYSKTTEADPNAPTN